MDDRTNGRMIFQSVPASHLAQPESRALGGRQRKERSLLSCVVSSGTHLARGITGQGYSIRVLPHYAMMFSAFLRKIRSTDKVKRETGSRRALQSEYPVSPRWGAVGMEPDIG